LDKKHLIICQNTIKRYFLTQPKILQCLHHGLNGWKDYTDFIICDPKTDFFLYLLLTRLKKNQQTEKSVSSINPFKSVIKITLKFI
jgi:hypothetical protein